MTGRELYARLVGDCPVLLEKFSGQNIIIHPPSGRFMIGDGVTDYDYFIARIASDSGLKPEEIGPRLWSRNIATVRLFVKDTFLAGKV